MYVLKHDWFGFYWWLINLWCVFLCLFSVAWLVVCINWKFNAFFFVLCHEPTPTFKIFNWRVFEPFELSSEKLNVSRVWTLLLDGWLLEWYLWRDVTWWKTTPKAAVRWDKGGSQIGYSAWVMSHYPYLGGTLSTCDRLICVDITITSRMKERISHCQNWHRRNDVFLWNFQDDQDICLTDPFHELFHQSGVHHSLGGNLAGCGGSFLCSSWSSMIASPNIL